MSNISFGDGQMLLNSVAAVGARYGLELHSGKSQLLLARVDLHLRGPTGESIESKQSIVNLGAALSSDGRIKGELSRHIGMA